MEVLIALLVGVLMAASVWLMLSRNLVKFLFGLVLISNVANIIIFVSGGLTFGAPALIGDDGSVEGFANALPQALVLTAIVIGFGLVSFTLVLALRAYQELGTVDVEEMCLAENGQEGTRPAEPAAGKVHERATDSSKPHSTREHTQGGTRGEIQGEIQGETPGETPGEAQGNERS